MKGVLAGVVIVGVKVIDTEHAELPLSDHSLVCAAADSS